jgi:hypothetical protein
MTTQLDLTQSIVNRLDQNTLECIFNKMGSSLTNNFSPNGYQAYLQVITWAILERLNASDSPQLTPLDEDRVSLIVDKKIRGMCNIIAEDLGYPDSTPPGLTSRAIWWTLKLCRRELI